MPIIAALLAIVLTAPALGVGFQTDDFWHYLALRNAEGLSGLGTAMWTLFSGPQAGSAVTRAAMQVGDLPWWTDPEFRLRFFRPIASATHWFDYHLWPDHSWPMHLQNILWYGVAVLMAGLLYRRLLGPTWLAGLAMLLYAVDDAHGYAVGWIASRNTVMATAFGLTTLWLHDRGQRDRDTLSRWLAPVCFALTLLSGEFGVGVSAYLFAYAVCLNPQPFPRRRRPALSRALSIAPYVVIGVLWYLGYRAIGSGAQGSPLYSDLGADPLATLRLFGQRLPFLLVGQWSLPWSDVVYLVSLEDRRRIWLLLLPGIALLSLLLIPLIRHNAVARFFALGMVVSLLPAVSTMPTDRLLYFAGFGAFGLIVLFLHGVLSGAAAWRPASPLYVWPARLVCVGLIWVHGAVAAVSLPARAYSPRFAQTALQAMDGLPSDASLREQLLILVNPPDIYVPGTLNAYRLARGGVLPDAIRLLAPGVLSIDVERSGSHSLIVRPRRGFYPPPGLPADENDYGGSAPTLWRRAIEQRANLGHLQQMLARLYRGEAAPMHVGQVVELDGMRVEVVAVDSERRALAAEFTFDEPLDSPRHRWIAWRDGEAFDWTPPPVGERQHLVGRATP